MLTKEGLKKEFEKNWKKHYEVELFREKGFIRKKCPNCGKNFWTLDPDRKLCGDPPCENYGFIGKTITKGKWDYIETWKQFEKFFVKEGHTSIPRYPVIDRWRPDLFFTIASIQDFQRLDQGNMVFEYPANPLVVPQVCLRFNDISNVGVTGRHHTSFIMSGQHAFGYPKEGYFKDRCMELNFGFLHRVMGIPETEITYIEDLWTMPDFSAFGPSIEAFSKGLELVNHVFMQFQEHGSGYKNLNTLVIDTGWGHERLVWFTQGTPTGYDAVFGPVIEWMKKQTGFQETELFERYAKLSGSLNIEDKNIQKTKEMIAGKLGISVKELNEIIEPIQALYAIADHSKTLLFAIADGGIPSNVGGGYNLRVLLRRCLSFMNQFSFNFTLDKIAELHSKHLKPMFPELSQGLEPFQKIMEIEKKRYENTLKKSESIIIKNIEKGLDTETLIKLYTSHGITPEVIERTAKKMKIDFSVPEDFYSLLTEKHMSEEKEEETKFDVSNLPKTKLLFYETPYKMDFSAKVIKVLGNWVVLDKTLFYPEGGGQPADRGFLIQNGQKIEVEDVQKIGGVVVHKAKGIKEGEVEGEIDWERRYQLMKMHTCTHIVAGCARKLLGKHIWQAGAKKGTKVSRIDLTHYKAFTREELEEIEKEANKVVKKNIKVETGFLPRGEAESRYGFILYQGGASPGKEVRVVAVDDIDIEACAGTHLKQTGEIEKIKIIRSSRIQDGVNRIEFTCGEALKEFEKEWEQIFNSSVSVLEELNIIVKKENILKQLQEASLALSVDFNSLPKTLERFLKEIKQKGERIKEISPEEYDKQRKEFEAGIKEAKTLKEICERIFDFWKKQEKTLEKLRKETAKKEAEKFLEKQKDGVIFEIVSLDRKEMIETASHLLSLNPELTVIFSNHTGYVVGMSKKHDMDRTIRNLCKEAGGSGGGRLEFAQGKAELSKLIKIKENKNISDFF